MYYVYYKYIDECLNSIQQVVITMDKLGILMPSTREDILYEYGVDLFENEAEYEREMRAMEKCL